jgi:hypothetical protein
VKLRDGICLTHKFCRAVERMVDFIRGPGKILKYVPKRSEFYSLGPPFSVRAPVKITASPPLSTALKFWKFPNFSAINEKVGSFIFKVDRF